MILAVIRAVVGHDTGLEQLSLSCGHHTHLELPPRTARCALCERDLRDSLVRVCRKAEHVLEGHSFALERLEAYSEDAGAGRLSAERLRGFLDGLFAAGLIDVSIFDELDRQIGSE